jgi:hypothetical protein
MHLEYRQWSDLSLPQLAGIILYTTILGANAPTLLSRKLEASITASLFFVLVAGIDFDPTISQSETENII